MTIEVRVPQLPESVADATLVTWHKRPGDAVARDENLVDLETDKVVLEVPAPMAGTLKEIRLDNGATVTSGQVLAILEEGAAAAPAPAAGAPAVSAAGKLSPAARRVVEESKIDATGIIGSGRGGRVSKSDVVQHLSGRDAAAGTGSKAPGAPASAAASASATMAPAAPAPMAAEPGARAARSGRGDARVEQRVAMTRLRQRIAERMVQAQATQALLTSFNEVDLSAVNALRAGYKEEFEKRNGVKLGFMSFFVKASVEALKKFPAINASVDASDILYHEYYDIGVAVSTDRGLIVPVVRDADILSFADIEKAVAGYAGRARAGTITMEELTGGTFTITNGGIFGSLLSTPIVNPPQSAILGMHKIQERPVVVDGAVVVRPMMYLALTYDHRIIDGREAVQFLVAVKQYLEDPMRLVLSL
ncbi:MAG: 2-oxoglutarate dehydrogenase complex dihydrolipoyllysine-residue succinyltransferase [Proteobacteria bacterium]|nr:2-oxoglutarate dehydrogenase complex dihydrolipoyllysine-residue succinyltransferase [Pseudomonadota bacterium]